MHFRQEELGGLSAMSEPHLCAVGGRTSVLGAVYGALLVNFAKTTLSESFPSFSNVLICN